MKPHMIGEPHNPPGQSPLGVEPVLSEAEPETATWGEDTIAAISTAIGPGAIGMVRMSGPDALTIAESAFQPARGTALSARETYRLLYGRVVDPLSGESVDEALLAVMRAPRSYTREDVVELHCHGGLAAQRAVLRLMVRLGARLAEPGEFTRRAFLNGRIDLAQAESVAAIVAARSSGALRASVRQLEGGLSEKLRVLRRELVGLLAQIEATVDFSDEDVDPLDWESLTKGLASVQNDLARLLRTAFLGRALEMGVRTAIVGRPNVGKSSLLNALLMRERAIVSETPGTTRDTVEELMEIGGIPIHLVDTAGMRSDGDHVEQLGVERSVRAMEQADLVLAVFDLSAPWDDTDERLVDSLDPARSIIVRNKSDLAPWAWAGQPGGLSQAAVPETDRQARHECAVSALTGEGLDDLRARIQQIITGGEGLHLEEPILATERQRGLVSEAVDSAGAALAGATLNSDEELVCEDIRGAVQALGRITGEELTPDLLDEIFSRFCLGK
ncbi:MAG: tRNA uridine-5-carboxymethylaminomethyl(34) synthesis GTPase MnmE [bacterium]